MKTPPGQEPALFIPGLRRFYHHAIPLSWVVVRFGVGWNLAVHGYGKVMRGMEAQTVALDKTMPWAQEYNYLLSHLLLFLIDILLIIFMISSSHNTKLVGFIGSRLECTKSSFLSDSSSGFVVQFLKLSPFNTCFCVVLLVVNYFSNRN